MEKQELDNRKGTRCLTSSTLYLLPCKISYFLFYSSLGCLIFINVFLVSIGMTPSEAGVISGLCDCVSSISGPCWGMLADRTGHRKCIFIVLLAGMATLFFSLPWVAAVFQKEYSVVCYRSNFTNLNDQTNTNGSNFPLSNDCNVLVPFQSSLFFAMLCLKMTGSIFATPALSFLDSIVMNVVAEEGHGYGMQRMYGAIGMGVTTLLAGLAADHYNIRGKSKYTAVFLVYLPLILLTIFNALLLFKKREVRKSRNTSYINNNVNEDEDDATSTLCISEIPQRKSRKQIIVDIGKRPKNIAVLLTTLIAGILFAVTASFSFLIIETEMNGTKASMGFFILVNCFSEGVMFAFSQSFFDVLGGPIICLEIGVLTWIVRSFAISYIKNAWLAALPQILQSFSFALYWAAMNKYIHEIAVKEVYTTLFGVFNSIYFGVGGLVGDVVGGIIFHYYGGPILFRSTGFLGCIWFMIMIAYFHCGRFITKEKTEV